MKSLNQQNSSDHFDDDSLFFVAENEEISTGKTIPAWKVMIVDDDDDVHSVTRLVLDNFNFMGRNIQFIDAYSGEEACRLLNEHPDMAVIFLDVVMETEHAGLDAVKRIREDIGNTLVRIILRTGQPGKAPEKSVIVNYDINDYKSKTDLTSQKMFTSLVAALRSFHDLKSIDANRRSVMKILEASSQLDLESLRIFVSGILMQLSNLLDVSENDLILVQQDEENGLLKIIASSGNYEPFIGDSVLDVLSPEVGKTIQYVIANKTDSVRQNYGVYVISGKNIGNVVAYLNGSKHLDQVDLVLVGIFCEKVLLAYDNCNLVEESQADLEKSLAILAKISNPSYTDPTGHAKYIGMLSRDIAENIAELTGGEHVNRPIRKQIAQAAMLCDIGNHSLPNDIWKNTGKLTEAERNLIQTHTTLGALLVNVTDSEDRGALQLAHTIILAHHERFDGSGYPLGISGKDIPLAARIVAVADTFISLTTERPYRKAFDHNEAVKIITDNSERLFDPAVVSAFVVVAGNYRQGNAYCG